MLIRRYLQAGIMGGGVVLDRLEGTPQGSPLSPLLANVLLDEVDKELERRGHKFAGTLTIATSMYGVRGQASVFYNH